MGVGDRIRETRKEKGLSQNDLAKSIGVNQAAISQLENGSTKSTRYVASIASRLGVSALWLETGRGQKSKDDDSTSNVTISEIGIRKIPVLNYIQAGSLTDVFDDNYSEYILTDLDLSEHAFALTIRGKSMLPIFEEGDKVIIDPNINPQPGDYVAVGSYSGAKATFKRYKLKSVKTETTEEVFEAVPLNDDYPTLRSDKDDLYIIGTMIEHRRYRKI